MTRIRCNIVAAQHDMRMKFCRNLTQLVRRCDVLRAEVKMMVLEQLRHNFMVGVKLLDENNSKRVLHLVLPVPFEMAGKRVRACCLKETNEAKW